MNHPQRKLYDILWNWLCRYALLAGMMSMMTPILWLIGWFLMFMGSQNDLTNAKRDGKTTTEHQLKSPLAKIEDKFDNWVSDKSIWSTWHAYMMYDIWCMINDTWIYMICIYIYWYLIYDIWHMIYDIWSCHEMNMFAMSYLSGTHTCHPQWERVHIYWRLATTAGEDTQTSTLLTQCCNCVPSSILRCQWKITKL